VTAQLRLDSATMSSFNAIDPLSDENSLLGVGGKKKSHHDVIYVLITGYFQFTVIFAKFVLKYDSDPLKRHTESLQSFPSIFQKLRCAALLQ